MIEAQELRVYQMSREEMARWGISELLKALVYQKMKLREFCLAGHEIAGHPKFDFMRLGEYFEEAGLSSVEQIEPVFFSLDLRQRAWLVQETVDTPAWERSQFQKSLLEFGHSLIVGDSFRGIIWVTETEDFRYNGALKSLWVMIRSSSNEKKQERLIRSCLELAEIHFSFNE